MITGIVAGALAASAPPVGASPMASDGANQAIYGEATYPAAFYDATGDATWVAWEAFLGGIRGIRCAVYDHASETWSDAFTISEQSLTDDSHGVPAICMDADGYVHCFFGAHISTLRHSVTVSPRDNSSWRQLADIGSVITYPHPVLVGSTMYLFYRNNLRDLNRIKSTSISGGTVTWGAAQTVIQFGASDRIYLGVPAVDGTDIYLPATRSNSDDTDRRDIYFARYDTTDDSLLNNDGSVDTAVGSQPVSVTTANTSYRLFTSSEDSGVPVLAKTPDGKLHLAFSDGDSAPFDIYYMVRTSGTWSSAAIVTDSTGGNYGGGTAHKFTLSLVPRSDNSVELWYPNDDASAFTVGGSMKRIVRSSGGTWGSEEEIMDPVGSDGLDRPSAVWNADPDLYVIFCEDTATETDSTAGDTRLYAYGSGGFVPRDETLPAEPAAVSEATDDYYYNNALLVTFDGSNGSTTFTDDSRYVNTLTANGSAQIQSNKLELNGTTDYVSVADSWLWQFGSRVSIELFGVEFDDATSDQVLVAQYRAEPNFRSWWFSFDNGRLKFYMVDQAGVVRPVISADFVPATDGTEYDIGLFWDGFMWNLCVNGRSLNRAGCDTPFANAPLVLTIGCDFNSAGTARRFFNGRIAATRIGRGVDRSGMAGTYSRHALPLPTTQSTLVDSEWPNVILLLEATDGGLIRDASAYDWPMTKNGNVAVSTSVEPFSGANSVAFDGTGDFLVIPDNAILDFGSGDYTIEAHVRHSVNTTIQHYASKWNATGNQRGWAMRYRGDAATDIIDMPISANGSTTATTVSSAAWTPTVGTFYHVELTRNGNNKRIFINGTQSGSTNTTAANVFDNTASLVIGDISNSAQPMNGYLLMRITKAARHTADFTAPSAAWPRG